MKLGAFTPATIIPVIAISLLAAGAAPPALAQEAVPDPLDEEVDRAIEKGVRWFHRILPNELREWERGHHLGLGSLIIYALLESGCPTDDPLLVEMLRSQSRNRPGPLKLEGTYAVAVYVLALHAWQSRAPDPDPTGAVPIEGTKEALPDGRRVRDEIRRSVEWLVAAQRRANGMWGYDLEPREGRDRGWVDFSNTQFAVLGLHVGLLEGIPVPADTLERLTDAYAGNFHRALEEMRFEVDRAPWLARDHGARRPPEERSDPVPPGTGDGHGRGDAPPLGRAFAPETLYGKPLAWGYTPHRTDPENPSRRMCATASFAMTCGAVSSLLVARSGLSGRAGIDRSRLAEIEGLIAGGVLEIAWKLWPRAERTRIVSGRDHYYTLYSMEKALSLAQVRLIDGVDWYRTQVPDLLARQATDGNWGDEIGGGRGGHLTSTAFALLFLARATERLVPPPHGGLAIEPGEPAIPTGGGETPRSVAAGRVFVPSLGGTIDLDELFRRLGERPTGELIDIAREAFEHIPPRERPGLLPRLLPLLDGDPESGGTAFARAQVAEFTGLPEGSERALLDAWFLCWARLGEIRERRDSRAIPEVAALACDPRLGTPLRIEAILALGLLGAFEEVPLLIDALEDRDAEVRAAAHAVARSLTLAGLPFDAEADVRTRHDQVLAWRRWWDSESGGRRTILCFEGLRERLEGADHPNERARIRAEIVALGPVVASRVDRIIASGSYAFDWLLVRRSLTGEAGVR